MTGTQTLIARAALGMVGATASIVLTSWPRFLYLPTRTFNRGVVATLMLSRVVLFLLLFGVFHLTPRGDVPAFYFPQAVETLRHHLPYRDFPSSYAPLHPYMDASFLYVWRSPLAIIFMSILAEMALLPLWLRLSRALFSEDTVRIAALLYVASPISLQFVTVDGQDNVLIALLLAAAMLLAFRSRNVLSGAMVGLSVVLVKFLPLLYAPAFFVALPKRRRWAVGAGGILATVYGVALSLHLPVLQPLLAEGAMRSAGNLPYLIESVSGTAIPSQASNGLLLLILSGIVIWIAIVMRRSSTAYRMRVLTFGMAALTLALLLFSKKSWPPYLMLCLFPLCLLVAGERSRPRWTITLFAIFSLTAVTEHSVWSSLLLEASSAKLHADLLARRHVAQLFFVLHMALLTGYLWLFVRSLRRFVSVETLPNSA